jgi:hypothetical protein
LKTEIVSSLDFQDILVLRRSTVAFKFLIDVSELEIVRFHIKYKLDSHTLELFPPPEPPLLNLEYLSAVHHRLIYSSKLSTCIADYTRDELYRRTTSKLRQTWATKHARLQQKMVPPILTLFKFFERLQETLLHYYCSLQNADRTQQLDPFDRVDFNLLKTEFTGPQILEAYKMWQLLAQALNRHWRAPSYAGRTERMLRGWNIDPPSQFDYNVLLIIGGLREVANTWNGHKSYASRRRLLDSTVARLSMETARKERDNLIDDSDMNPARSIRARLLSWGSESDGPPQTRFQMPMKPPSLVGVSAILDLLPALPPIWTPAAEAVLINTDVVENMDEVENYTVWIEALIKDEEDDVVQDEGDEQAEVEDQGNEPLAWS